MKKTNKKIAIQFGAGNIGRGFLGELFFKSGYEIFFVDVNSELIKNLNEKNCYKLKIAGKVPKEVLINNVHAVNIKDIDKVKDLIIHADIIATAVGVKSIKDVSKVLAKGIIERAVKNGKVINIIICENILDAGKVLRDYLLQKVDEKFKNYVIEKVGLVESVVSRMVSLTPEEEIKKDKLIVLAEEYAILPVDKKGFIGDIPQIIGMIPYDNLKAYEERKLFIHNAGHAMIAYLAALKGFKYIWQGIEDEWIRKITISGIGEIADALIKKHKFDKKELEEYINDIIERFDNVSLGDSVFRVGRDPIRKLSPNDRLIGAARLIMEYGGKPVNLSFAIASCLLYNEKEDKESQKLQKLIQEKGIEAVLEEICKVDRGSELTILIKQRIKDLKGG